MKLKMLSRRKINFLFTALFSVFFFACSEIEIPVSKGGSSVLGFTVYLDDDFEDVARSASPSEFKDKNGGELVFGGRLFEDYISRGPIMKGEYDPDEKRLVIPMPYSASRRPYCYLEIYAFANGTTITSTTNYYDALLQYTESGISIPADATSPSLSRKIKMVPNDYTTEKGKVDLYISISNPTTDFDSPNPTYTLDVNYPFNDAVNLTPKDSSTYHFEIPQATLTKNTNYSNAPTGTKFMLKKNGVIISSWTEVINVLPGITTNRWNTDIGEVDANGYRIVDASKFYSDFYVRNTDGSSWYDLFHSDSGSDSSGNGSIRKPYLSIGKVLNQINALADFEKTYNIYIDGNFSAGIGSNNSADFSIFGNNEATVTITGLNVYKATLSNGIYNRGSNVTLKNCFIKNTGSYPGSGIQLAGGTLTFAGSVKVSEDNSVFLGQGTFITLAANITENGSIAKIVLSESDYESGRTILKASDSVRITTDLCNKFEILDKDGNAQTQYTIVPSSDGKSGILSN